MKILDLSDDVLGMMRQELAMIRERDFKNDFNFVILELTHHNRVFNMGKAYFWMG